MKKVLFTLGLVLSITMMEAKSTYDLPTTNRYNQRQLQFVAHGVEFLIFKNGEFDFNTHPRRSGRRTGYNATYGAPKTHRYYGNPRRGVRIEHDYYGRVRRVGNTFINYDSRSRVKRIGTVYISYNRRGLVKQIGGLHIYYTSRNRIAYTRGHIKRNNNNAWHTYYNDEWQTLTDDDCDNNWNDSEITYPYNDDDSDYNTNDDDMYYYKQAPKKGKTSIKKRK